MDLPLLLSCDHNDAGSARIQCVFLCEQHMTFNRNANLLLSVDFTRTTRKVVYESLLAVKRVRLIRLASPPHLVGVLQAQEFSIIVPINSSYLIEIQC